MVPTPVGGVNRMEVRTMNNFNQVCPSGNTMVDGHLEIRPETEILTEVEELKEYLQREGIDPADMDYASHMEIFYSQGYIEVEKDVW